MRQIAICLVLLCVGCFGPGELSPRYVDPMTRDRIQPEGNFTGVHFHNIPTGWEYLSVPGSGPGDMAQLVSERYDAMFWLSTNPGFSDPCIAALEIRRMRATSYLYGEAFMGWNMQCPNSASITYTVDRKMDGQLVEVQRTAYRRLSGRDDERITMSLHGRWPLANHKHVSAVFDTLVADATLQ